MSSAPNTDFAAIVEQLHDGVYALDAEGRISYWNPAAEQLTGYSAEEVLGRRCSDNLLVHVDAKGMPLCQTACPMRQSMTDGQSRECSVYLHHKRGHRVPVNARVIPLTGKAGETTGAVQVFRDTSSMEAMRARIRLLERLALIDALTQIPNRTYLESEVAAHLAMLARTGVPFGVLMVDVDHFKRFNDQFGHEVGDAALRTIAQTMGAIVRPFDIVGRWGGEEFVGVFPNTTAVGLASIAQRLCAMVRQSQVETPDGPVAITVSVGATCARPQDSLTSLLRRADGLMYLSKQHGRNRVTLDSDRQPASAGPRLIIERASTTAA